MKETQNGRNTKREKGKLTISFRNVSSHALQVICFK